VVHIYFLITARDRFIVAFTWLWDYVTFQRGARLITEVPPAETALPTATIPGQLGRGVCSR
jgi:NADH dehydrogenase